MRRRKKQCKAARKALLKAGLKDSPEEEIIRKEWFSLVRQHNKLRAALAKKELAKGKLKAEKAFRADPHKFAAKLFSAKCQAGKPTFSAADAQQYFEKTYRDEERDHSYVPLPTIGSPPDSSSRLLSSLPNYKRTEKECAQEAKWGRTRNECSHLCPLQKMHCSDEVSHEAWTQGLEMQRHTC